MKTILLWNSNFLCLWAGQLVSAIGDAVYAVALGFWILDRTGSTALMGSLMAVATLPRIIVSPLAGVIVDRSNRQWLLISMDLIRGAAVVLLGIAALRNELAIWTLFAAGVLIGLGGAFFNPAVSSVIPDIVPGKKLIAANAVFNAINTGSGFIGNSGGGLLYRLLGGPVLFLANGLTYLVSALTLMFVRIPPIAATVTRVTFFRDLKDGFIYVWNFRGLKILIVTAAILNFFARLGIMLVLPLFHRHPNLGPSLYGFVMASFAAGLLLGFVIASVYNFKPRNRFAVFSACCILTSLNMMLFPVFLNFPLMAAIAFATGLVNAVLNSFISAIAQLTVPADKRGKVFGMMTTILGGLTPIAFGFGGLVAEFVPIRLLIASSFALTLFLYIPLFVSPDFKKFVNYDPAIDAIGDLR